MVAFLGIVAVAGIAGYYVKHHGVAASVAAVKREAANIEEEIKLEEPIVKAKVQSAVNRLKALL